MQAAVDEDLTGRVRSHLASTGLVLSRYQLARVLAERLPEVERALAELERRGEVVRVVEAADECDARLVTRWRAACTSIRR